MPRKHWLLRIVPDIPYGRLLCGIVLFALLYPLFSLGVRGDPQDRTPALFFSLLMAYIIPIIWRRFLVDDVTAEYLLGCLAATLTVRKTSACTLQSAITLESAVRTL